MVDTLDWQHFMKIEMPGWYRLGLDDYMWIGRHLKVHMFMRGDHWQVWACSNLGAKSWSRLGEYATQEKAKERAFSMVRAYQDNAQPELTL